jgi:two-component system cell cycle response regulator
MPDTDINKAYLVGERLRQCIAAAPFFAGERHGSLEVTASVGVASLEFADDTPDLILRRADQALYCAKRDGRNRVVADAA